MKTKKRHISTEKKLLSGVIASTILLFGLLYLYHNYWDGVYIVDSVPTSILGIVIIIVISLTICTMFVFGGFLFGISFPMGTKKQPTNLCDEYTNVTIKDFDSFPLAKFISKDDISCIAKIDTDGKISYSFNLRAKLYQTDDYELFSTYFKD